jgi:hypothetical protein
MIPPLKMLASSLSSDQVSRLFAHYNSIDFIGDVENYDLRRKQNDPVVSVHWFRIARILRDLLFTCPSIEFGHYMATHTDSGDANYPGVRLYSLNQTTLRPFWNGAGLPYVGVAHGSDTHYIFNGVYPEGKLTEIDMENARRFSSSFINFAYSGDPNMSDAEPWPQAYVFHNSSNTEPFLSQLNIQVMGGQHESGSVSLIPPSFVGPSEKMQQVVGPGDIEIADNKSFGPYRIQQEMESEKLFSRCQYISSLADSLDV